VFKGKRAETALCISISGFVVDGDLGSEKVRDTFAEKLLKLLINFIVCNGQLCSCKMLPACSNQHQQVILKGRRAWQSMQDIMLQHLEDERQLSEHKLSQPSHHIVVLVFLACQLTSCM